MARPAKEKRYTSISFEIYEALSWDREKLILALDVIRKKFCETRDLSRHGLTAHIMPRERSEKPGELYPVMGLVIPTSKHFGHFDTHSILSHFEAWSETHAITELLEEASGIGVPSWEELVKQGTYPVDPRTLY